MKTLDLVLSIVALVCFIIATVGKPVGRFNLVAAGLALLTLILVLNGLSGVVSIGPK